MARKPMSRKMQMITAAVTLLAVGLAVFALFGGGTKEETLAQGNLIVNGEFSDVTNGQPDGWTQGMWVTSPGASYLEVVTLEGGANAVLIENAGANDARYEQVVPVRENATYRLSAKIRAEGVGEGMTGANLSFLGVYGTSESVYDTDGVFETVTVYAQTGKGQKEATVCLRLGGYGAENMGKAWFTDVSLEQVETVPVGEEVLYIATPEPQKESKEEQKNDKGSVIPGLFAVSGAYLAFALYVSLRLLSGDARALDEKKRSFLPLAAGLAAAMIARLVLAASVKGYGVDMGCFAAWGGKMASGGPANFYEPGYFCDYPPAYMLVLGAIAGMANLLSLPLGGAGHEFLLKLVPIACDAALALLIYRAARRETNEKTALGLSLLMAFNPAFVIAGSCWGQIDAVLTVMILLFLRFAREGRWHVAIPLFALAVLAKPQAGLLAPLGVAALIKELMPKEGRAKAAKSIAMGVGLGALVTLGIVLPFSPKQDSAFWLVDKYLETLGSYDYATLSTGNLMFLLGGNWTPNTSETVLGLTFGQLGMGLMALSFAAGIALHLRARGRSRLMLSAALTLQLLFCLGTKMHERYILPAIALLLLSYIDLRDVRLLASAILTSVASALNIGAVLAFEHLIAPNLWLGDLIGVMQLLAAAMTVWASVSDMLGRAPMQLAPDTQKRLFGDEAAQEEGETASAAQVRMRRELLEGTDYRLHLRARDAVIMFALTAAYAVVAFYNLGATSAPQSGYASSAQGESVVIDLGENHEDFAIYYYGGISDTQFSFAVSQDGVHYGEDTGAFFDRGECFKWQAMRTPAYDENGRVSGASGSMLRFSGRYIRVTFEGAGSALWEVAAVDENGRVIPAISAQGFDALEGRADDPMSLIDEQETVPDAPGYLNSMYFDEIYHARTGYEHANALHTYETTHPPLGKVFMSWCIELLGMTPFAWRFAGALTGVLMIPAIYLLAMQLLHSTKWAALSALLLSADCMHFTQTRIATIDSFPVLFMMLMFLFMARWMQMSFYHQRLRDTLVPLALSGVFMGLAIASKWIGCYGAVGLAALFFARFFVLWRQSVYAREHQGEDHAFVHAANSFAQNGAKTIASCFVFFVFVPLIIYCLSYIPYLSAYGEVKWNLATFRRIWDAQVLMFDYHANLVAEHYFASPWYEWPLIVKPMWFYNADYAPAGMASSILTFGNPAVWWTGLIGIVLALLMSLRYNALPMLGVLPGRDDPYDRALPVIAVGFLSAYLPWVLVSRLTFIYHYFASVPFIILASAQMLRYLERRNKKAAYGIAIVLGAAAVILFVAFYPLASGAQVPRSWCDAVAWFDNWMWY